MPEILRVCGECKHWGRPGTLRKAFEVCTAIGGRESEPPAGVQAYFSNPDAWFLTAAEFGCALFEKRSDVHSPSLPDKERNASGELASERVAAGQLVYLELMGHSFGHAPHQIRVTETCREGSLHPTAGALC